MRFIILLILNSSLIILNSCVTRKACESRFGPCGEEEVFTSIEHHDSLVFVEGFTLHDTLFLPVAGKDTVIERLVTDPNSMATLRLHYEAKTRKLLAQCQQQRDTLVVTNTIYKEGRVKTITEEVPVTPDWVIAGGVVAAAMLLLWLIYKIKGGLI